MRSLYFISFVFGCMLLITLSNASTTESQSDNNTEEMTQPTTTIKKQTATTQSEPTTTKPAPTTTTQPDPTSTEINYQATTLICNCSLYPLTTRRSGEVTQQATDTETSTNPTTASKNTTTSQPTTKSLTTTPTSTTTPKPTAPTTQTNPTSKIPTTKTTPTPTATPTTITPTTIPTTTTTITPTTMPTTTTTITPTNIPTTTTTITSTTIPTTTTPTTIPTTTTTITSTTIPTTTTITPTTIPTTTTTITPTTIPTTTTTITSTTIPTTTITSTTTPTTTSTTTSTTKPTTTSTITPTPTSTTTSTTTPTTTSTTTPTTTSTTAPATTPAITSAIKKNTNGSNSHSNDEEVSINMVDEENSTIYSYCYDVCNNRTDLTSTTSVPTIVTTTVPVITTTKKIRQRPANLSGKTVKVDLVVIVKGNFTAEVPDRNLHEYDNYSRQFNKALTEFYHNILGYLFKRIVINGFSEGSIQCNYTVKMKAPTNETEANTVLKDLKKANWTLLNTTVIGEVLENETRYEQNKILVNVDSIVYNVCEQQEVFRFDSNNNGDAVCLYKCDDVKTKKPDCGVHGSCVVTYTGDIKCLCKDDNNNVYHGDSCKKTIPVHGSTTVKTVVVTESLSRTDIIAIAAGTGGALVLLLLISLVCVCKRLQSAKKRNKFYSYMGNDKEALHSENSRIENVPSVKHDNTNKAYVRDSEYMQLQRFEPEGKNVDHETGQRQGSERDEKSYRKVETPEVGNVTIYQPSHLKEPIDRQSGASKFDREEVQAHPFHMVDTEKSYKIRRPTVNSDTNIPYN